ncbi:unnamed protein product [Cyprideis torosa]|uniref:Uncharacterized protein n=1 Tax=Cyprideis torosa TaxID=163714 RepID=A0A7R8W2J8_9CRUS|nr:unnamed protein product [Cyprideis torosa]CAG0879852.1 unnamed protein product [Cyprideis torosa]
MFLSKLRAHLDIAVLILFVLAWDLLVSQMSRMKHYTTLGEGLYSAFVSDLELQDIDYNEWYQLNLMEYPELLRSRFVQLDYDDATREFVTKCTEQSDWFLTHLYNAVVSTFLKPFMTATSINGKRRSSCFSFKEELLLL